MASELDAAQIETPTQVGPSLDSAFLGAGAQTSEAEKIQTPTKEGPSLDPALLGAAGLSADAEKIETPTQNGPSLDPALLGAAGLSADAEKIETPTQNGPSLDPALLGAGGQTSETEKVETPRRDGPSLDPALLGAAGLSSDAEKVGFNITMNTLRKYSKELADIREDALKRLLGGAPASASQSNEQNIRSTYTAISNKSTTSRRSSASRNSSKPSSYLLALTDMSITRYDQHATLEAHVLSSISLAVFAASTLIGSSLLSPLIGLFIQPFGAGLLSVALVPLAIFGSFGKPYHGISNLTISAVQGILAGSAISQLSLPMEPLIFISPIIAIGAVLSTDRNSRPMAVHAISSLTIGFHIAFAALSGSFTFAFVLQSLLYAAASLAPVQIFASRYHDGVSYKSAEWNRSFDIACAASIGFTIASKLAIYALFGEELTIAQPANI